MKTSDECEDELARLSWAKDVPAPIDADGRLVPLSTETLYTNDGERVTLEEVSFDGTWWYAMCSDTSRIRLLRLHLSKPDSWERLEEDVNLGCRDYCERYRLEECDYNMRVHMLSRAKALGNLHEGMKDTPKAMVSQPMAGETDEQIAATRERATASLEAMGYEVVDTLFTEEAVEVSGVVQVPLCFLAKSLESMSLCHAVYFCKGWENARGCRIEHDAAVAYGLEVLYED